MKIDDRIVGQHLREIRNQRRLTQDQVAEKLGFTNGSYYARIERGEASLTLERLYDLCEVFQVGPGAIMNGAVGDIRFIEQDSIESPERAALLRMIDQASHDTLIAMHAACEGLFRVLEKQ